MCGCFDGEKGLALILLIDDHKGYIISQPFSQLCVAHFIALFFGKAMLMFYSIHFLFNAELH